MKTTHIVPLSHQAVAILRELHPLTGRGRYVFPSLRTGERPMSENTVNAALRRLGYDKSEMTGHGFRSMASTLLNEQGWHHDAIERQLAHTERDAVRGAYNYAQHLPERRRMIQACGLTIWTGCAVARLYCHSGPRSRLSIAKPRERDPKAGIHHRPGLASNLVSGTHGERMKPGTKYLIRLLTKAKEHLEERRTLSDESLGATVEVVLPTVIKGLAKRLKGAGEAYGTAEENQLRWDKYQAYIDKLHTEDPEFSYNKLCDIAGAEFEVDSTTIWRRTTDPTK